MTYKRFVLDCKYMKYPQNYLIEGIQMDGGHEHHVFVIIDAATENSLANKIKRVFKKNKQGFDAKDSYFGYGDQETITDHYNTKALTSSDAFFLINQGIVKKYLI